MSKRNDDFFKSKNRWSEIKDSLLGCYLMPYFQKVLRTNTPIYYVDCFAGKGKFDEGKPGSPRIALDVRDQCLQATKSRSAKIDTCFIELNYANELRENIASFNRNSSPVKIISGKYEEKILETIIDKQAMNVFLYIDPYGIKALDSELFAKFRTLGFRSFEMLINFNSFGFFRDACRVMKVDCKNDEAFSGLEDIIEYEPTSVGPNKKSEELLNRIAGGNYWKSIVEGYKRSKYDGYCAEKQLSSEYKKVLRQYFDYVLDMPIRLKPGNRPKYRMIHVCNHEDGVNLMAKNMLKRKDELFLRIQQEGQTTIFDNDPSICSTIDNDYLTFDQIKKLVEEYISRELKEVGLTRFIAGFFNEYGLICDFNMIEDSLCKLQGENIIQVRRIPEFTKKLNKPSSFWTESKENKVYILRKNA